MDLETQPMYHETQRVRQTWVWLVFVGLCALFLILLGPGLYRQLSLGEPAGGSPDSQEGLMAGAAVAFGILFVIGLFLWCCRLDVRVEQSGLDVRYFPFLRRHYGLDEIRGWKAVTYRPLSDYGGWGIRRSWRGNGWAYTVGGNQGVLLDLSSRKRPLLVGSAEPEALATAIARAKQAA